MKTSLGATAIVLVFGLLLVVVMNQQQQHVSAQNNSNFDVLLEDSGANLLQQDLDNEQAFTDRLDTKLAR